MEIDQEPTRGRDAPQSRPRSLFRSTRHYRPLVPFGTAFPAHYSCLSVSSVLSVVQWGSFWVLILLGALGVPRSGRGQAWRPTRIFVAAWAAQTATLFTAEDAEERGGKAKPFAVLCALCVSAAKLPRTGRGKVSPPPAAPPPACRRTLARGPDRRSARR